MENILLRIYALEKPPMFSYMYIHAHICNQRNLNTKFIYFNKHLRSFPHKKKISGKLYWKIGMCVHQKIIYQIWPFVNTNSIPNKKKNTSHRDSYRSRTIYGYQTYSFPKQKKKNNFKDDLVRWQYCRITVRRCTGGYRVE